MIEIYLARAMTPQGEKKHQWEHELGKRLLYKGLKERYGMTEESLNQVQIAVGVHGKPYLKDFPHIHYNISHTEGMAVCGFADRELGVDVERIRSYRDNILRKVMSDFERRRLEELPEADRSDYFFRIWTLKESYGKATGRGILIPLSDVSFTLMEKENPGCSVPGVSFSQQLLDGGFVLSVCQLGDEEITFKLISVS